ILGPVTRNFSGVGVLVALAIGYKVVAAARNAEKLKVLERYHGAKERLTMVVLTGDTDVGAKALKNTTGGKGVHDFLDYSPSSLKEELPFFHGRSHFFRGDGEYVLLRGAFADFKIPYQETILSELKIRGKFMYEREHIERFSRMVDTGSLKINLEAGLRDGFKYYSLDQVKMALYMDPGWAFGHQSLFTPNKEKAH
ncbi:hypothetical protein J3E71DRAFT_175381, partial [Bipolaris maydis]